jgi:hypothetical protein
VLGVVVFVARFLGRARAVAGYYDWVPLPSHRSDLRGGPSCSRSERTAIGRSRRNRRAGWR